MQPTSDYLKKLLYQYDCIVVPALGAFLTHSVSASYNETTGQYLPPRRKVAFNEALRLDDGILLNYVMFQESCSREEALQAIQQFVADVKMQVRVQGSFAIEGLGMFSANSENNLLFDPELRHNFMGNAYGLQPLVLTRQMVHPAVPVVAQASPVVTVVKPLPVTALAVAGSPATTTELGEVMPMPVSPARSQPGWRWVAAVVMVGTLGMISYFSVIAPNHSLQSSLNPGHLFRLPAELFTRAEVSTPASEATTTTAVKPEAAVNTPVAAQPVATPTAAPASSVVVESPAPVDVVAPKAAPRKVVTPEPALPTVPFTVIAGSFANRSNAIRFQKMLRRAGYGEAYILPGRAKGLIKVAAVGTEELAVAQASLDSLNTLTGIKPWILRSH